MIFPTTTLAALLAVILGLVCWSSWANLYKLTTRWRFEFFYYDFTWGVLLVAIVAAFTLGSMNSQELTFQDNFLLTGYRKMGWGWSAGVVLNLGNMLVLASVVVAGMSVAFPISLGLAAILSAAWTFILDTRGPAMLPFAGSVLLAVAVVLCVMAHIWKLQDIQAAAQRAFIADPRTKAAPRRGAPLRGILLAAAGGILIAIARPMLTEALVGDNGVSAYGEALLFTLGMVFSSLLFVPFFLNFPVAGKPEQVRLYFKGAKKHHFLGILAGMVWGAGLLALLVSSQAPAAARVNPATGYVLTESVMVLAACWGLFAWREFKGSAARVQMMLTCMLVLMLAGVAVIAIAHRVG